VEMEESGLFEKGKQLFYLKPQSGQINSRHFAPMSFYEYAVKGCRPN